MKRTSASFAYATTLNVLGKSAKFDMIVSYMSLAAKGLVFGVPHERYVTGFADPAFRFSMNFIGAPALTMAQFKDYRQDFILGASLRITAPLGQYNYDKLVNIGTNRWSFKPEIGMSKAIGPWTVELTPGITFFTDNGDFFGGKTRQVAPLVGVQAGVIYTYAPGGWLALNAGYFVGSRTTVDDVENDDEQEGMRFGATLALPVNRYNSVKALRHHRLQRASGTRLPGRRRRVAMSLGRRVLNGLLCHLDMRRPSFRCKKHACGFERFIPLLSLSVAFLARTLVRSGG
jgi:hypothetical protein